LGLHMRLWLRWKGAHAKRRQGNLSENRHFEYRTGNVAVILESTCEVDEAASGSQALVSTATTHLPQYLKHWWAQLPRTCRQIIGITLLVSDIRISNNFIWLNQNYEIETNAMEDDTMAETKVMRTGGKETTRKTYV
jgi:hypothetical protein